MKETVGDLCLRLVSVCCGIALCSAIYSCSGTVGKNVQNGEVSLEKVQHVVVVVSQGKDTGMLSGEESLLLAKIVKRLEKTGRFTKVTGTMSNAKKADLDGDLLVDCRITKLVGYREYDEHDKALAESIAIQTGAVIASTESREVASALMPLYSQAHVVLVGNSGSGAAEVELFVELTEIGSGKRVGMAILGGESYTGSASDKAAKAVAQFVIGKR